MAAEFVMPKLGLTMEEGTITEWYVDDGAHVEAGTAVLAITTDKTDSDVEASATGRLAQVAAVGQTLACGELIGWFLAEGESAPAAVAAVTTATAALAAPTASSAEPPASAVSAGARIPASPYARRLAAERGIAIGGVRGTGPGGRIVAADLEGVVAPASAPTPDPAAPRPAASTLATFAARSLADLLGVDVGDVAPDPRTGRVGRDDVAAHVRHLLSENRPSPEPSAVPLAQEPTAVIPLSGMRGTIARRMSASLEEMAQLTLHMDADFSAVVADRQERRAAGAAPGYTDYVIAACARALADHPVVNSQVTADGVALLPDVHVGMAVALDDGLIVPVVQDTLGHDLESLAAETSRLAEAARAGTLQFSELEGGTFSVTTLGMYGVDGFTPIINPPNTAILGVGRIRQDVAVTDDGEVTTVARATLSLTWDHRAFDGAPAAAFCRAVVDALASVHH